jgi:hypothetical protein
LGRIIRLATLFIALSVGLQVVDVSVGGRGFILVRPAYGQTAQEIKGLLDAFRANPSRENAMAVLANRSRLNTFVKADVISMQEYGQTIWDVDDVKIDMLNERLSGSGQAGSEFQVSTYGSDSTRPPTRSQVRSANPGMSEAELSQEMARLRSPSQTRFDVTRSDHDMCFTGPDGQRVGRQAFQGIEAEFRSRGFQVNASNLGLNEAPFARVPGRGYDARLGLVANPEMYNSRGGIKWVNNRMYQEGFVTYWDADAGRMVTQKISQYTGKAPLPFQPSSAIAEEEAFGFMADNYKQLQLHLNQSKSDLERLEWIQKYLGRGLDSSPGGFRARLNLTPEEARLLEATASVLRGRDAQQVGQQLREMEALYRNLLERGNNAQMEILAERLAQLRPGESVAGNAHIRLMIEELAGSYVNIGIDRAKQLVAAAEKIYGKRSNVYKALYTALEQAKDLRDEAEILRLLEEQFGLASTIKVKITRPDSPGKPTEAKLEDPLQTKALEKLSQQSAGDADISDAVEFRKNFPNSGVVLGDKKLFSENFRASRAGEFESLVEGGIKAATPEELARAQDKLRQVVKAHLDREIQQSWMVRHRMWTQLPREAKDTVLYTRGFFAELGYKIPTTIEGAAGAVKGVVLRHKLITGLMFISAAYGWYTGGPWGAVDALWETGKAIAVFEAINWVCFHGAKKLATMTGLAALGPVGAAIGILYNVYEISKLVVLLQPVMADLFVRGTDYFIFGGYSEVSMKRFLYGTPTGGVITDRDQFPGFFSSADGNNSTVRGTAKSEKDLFPVFATPEELEAAVNKEWDWGTTGQHGFFLSGQLTLRKAQELLLAEWKKSFALKINEYLQSFASGTAQDEDIEKFEQTSAGETSKNWTDLYGTTQGMIFAFETDPDPPAAGQSVDLKCQYVLFGLPGQSLQTKLVLRVKSPKGETAEEVTTTTTFGEAAVETAERTEKVSVSKSFSLEAGLDLARTVFIAELYDYQGRLIDQYKMNAGLATTTIETKVRRAGTDASANDWAVDISVKDADGKLVDAGEIKVEADKGRFDGSSEWEGPLDKGTKTVVWTGPADKAEKATAKITYFGDQRPPGVPDKKYAECEKTIELPPAALETKISVIVTPAPSTDKKANDWTLEIRVRDMNEKAVTAGYLSATTDKGGLDGKGKTEWEAALQGGEAKVLWTGPADMKDKATVEIRYLGDEKDPAKEDKIYAESKTSVQVPPDALETKVEVEAKPARPDPKSNEWKLDVLVKDVNDKPVEMGDLKVTAPDGGLEKPGALEWTGTLKGGKAQLTWLGPPDKTKKVEITLTYLGDEKDPATPDAKYKESEAKIKLPRALETEVVVKTTPDPKNPKKWEIELNVKDELGRDVAVGTLDVEVTDGSVEMPGTTKTGCDLSNIRPLKFPFFAPDDPKKRAKVTAKYHGDIEDPNVPDELYKDSEKSFSLPPELALTSIEVKTSKVDPNNPKSNDWAMSIEVKEESGAYVSLGDLLVTCDEGAIETKGQTTWTGALNGGKATVKWLGPDDPQKKAVVTIKYLGDQKDPALPDLKYGEAEKTVKMPPRLLKPTTVTIIPSLVDEKKKIWKLETEVKDDKGAPVSKGAVRYTATGGSFKDASLVLDVTMTLQNGKYLKAWKQTDDDVQTITAKYLGDEADPAKEDALYEESEAAVKLPPERLEKSTVFVIDASGSMSGAKLASAKEAVRASLGGYMGKENKEEWALFAFFDCGSIQLLQGFTRDPAKVTAQLGFDAAGSTPVAASIRAARNYLLRAARGKTGRIILLSDGGENCSGKPIEEAKSIRVRTLTVDLGK